MDNEKDRRYEAQQGLPPEVLIESLFLAADAGDADKVTARLKQGADQNWQNDGGQTALMWAAKAGHDNVVRTLLENGANPNIIDREGRTALTLAMISSRDHARGDPLSPNDGAKRAVRLLLENGADPNLGVPGEMPPLHSAAYRGETDVVKLLLEKGANPTMRIENLSAEDFANRQSRKELVEILRVAKQKWEQANKQF